MNIAFYINDFKPGAKAAAVELSSRAKELGLEVVGISALSTLHSALCTPHSAPCIIIALGGDGTILRCVHEHPGMPVIGFNLGGLGYLSTVEKKDFDSALELIAEGRYRIAERTMLSLGGHLALNDIVITREMTGHAALLDLSVDGRRATRYLADGLVIATPTGSTAYSLSAGGPVVMSDSRSFVITPMNPHALGIRPQVVSDSVRISVASIVRGQSSTSQLPNSRPLNLSTSLGIYADGEAVAMLAPGESVEIVKAGQVAKFVELEGYDPYAILAHKLGWTGTSL